MSNIHLSLGKAAQATGKNKSTIYRAIKSGKLSANKVDGDYHIDPAELFRVFDATSETEKKTGSSNDAQPHVTGENTSEMVASIIELGVLRAEVKSLNETVSYLRQDKDHLRKQLEAESDERRRLNMMLITNQTTKGSSWLVRAFVAALLGSLVVAAVLFWRLHATA